MKFRVIKRYDAEPRDALPAFVLRQDRWDDFGFKTMYELSLRRSATDKTLIGNVKIIQQGQTRTPTSILVADFAELDESFVSIGQSLDYYERLSELGPVQRDRVLLALRDIVKYPEYADRFQNEEGWKTSLFRDGWPDDEFILLAKSLLTGDYTTLPAEDLAFSFASSGWKTPLKFDFTAPADSRSLLGARDPLPTRIAVLIGRNGSGKSTLLARLARVAHGSPNSRDQQPLVNLGSISPSGIGFPRIVTISYSAFDTFRLPGVSRSEQEQIVKDLERNEGRFVFCGLRDIAAEIKAHLRQQQSASTDFDSEQEVSAIDPDRLHSTLLKPIEALAEEFVRSLAQIANKNRAALFDSALVKILADPSFDDLKHTDLAKLQSDDPHKAFLSWSTGHKIVMQIVSSITAYVEPRSLILIDEPETHLHPPLLASLMHAVRHILTAQKAFAIIATHSPVVLQETLSKHVFIIRREGETTDVRSPTIETFGENIGMITSEVFGLNSDVTDFHGILDFIVKRIDDLETIETLFQSGGMSNQARAYVMRKLAPAKSQ